MRVHNKLAIIIHQLRRGAETHTGYTGILAAAADLLLPVKVHQQ